MDIEKDIIQDQKETIHRLQEECKEKTDIIMALEQENAELKKLCTENSKEWLKDHTIQSLIKEKNCLNKVIDKFEELTHQLEQKNLEIEMANTFKNVRIELLEQTLEEIREMTKAVRYFPQERLELIRNKINEILQ